jgi:hypothetical protein
MAYRNGTYIAFHGSGEKDPSQSDFRYYAQLKAWDANRHHDFEFNDSHVRTSALSDRTSRDTIERRLRERLNNSKNMVLIVTETTRGDTDFVPLEIQHAIDECEIPIIAAYPGYEYILDPAALGWMWPKALATRIQTGVAHVIHVPFKQAPLSNAIGQFGVQKFPLGGGLGVYSREAYREWGLL